ncbi:MAG: hypothetical protein N3C62_04410 [Synergistetes bacterium]|nr:hypothetical protein [Synergistota bacterium]MCX8127956.1 hypothetical protein [Synergistota bacterium]MDW8192003.1 hypothetical protein [Synergistota bacterium]
MLGRFLILIIIVFMIFPLFGCIGLSRWRSYYYTGDLEIEEIYICMDVDDDLNPIDVRNRFDYGIKRVCLFFRYRYVDGEVALLRIRWYYQGVFVHQVSYYLDSGYGKKAYYFFLASGESLPKGDYEVRVMFKGRIVKVLNFKIEGKGGS